MKSTLASVQPKLALFLVFSTIKLIETNCVILLCQRKDKNLINLRNFNIDTKLHCQMKLIKI